MKIIDRASISIDKDSHPTIIFFDFIIVLKKIRTYFYFAIDKDTGEVKFFGNFIIKIILNFLKYETTYRNKNKDKQKFGMILEYFFEKNDKLLLFMITHDFEFDILKKFDLIKED